MSTVIEEEEDNKPTPAMFDHCTRVYKEMLAQAEDIAGDLVYTGYLTRLFQGLELSPPYYSTVRDLLVRMGCVEQLRRGGGNAQSKWRLVRKPTEEAFMAANAMNVQKGGKVANLEQGLQSMNNRLLKVEEILGLRGGVEVDA